MRSQRIGFFRIKRLAGNLNVTDPVLSCDSREITLGVSGHRAFYTRIHRKCDTGYLLEAAALLGIAVVPLATGLVTGLDTTQAFIVFSALLAVFVLLVLFVYDVRPWTAIFCATAGYTLQNIASGLEILIQLVVTHSASAQLDGAWDAVVSIGVPTVVYAAGYWLLVRRVNVKGLLEVENRMMLSMLVVVVIVVIGFDVIIKALVFKGIPFNLLVLLRLVHPMVCVFVLIAEYELLYAKHADIERAETERLLAERERQYRLSRENIEAINIKCHDIKHQIRHLAQSGAVVDGAVLADIEREVNVYDSVVETGNEALDTILTEKSLACRRAGITLSCIADGPALDFMSAADIYAFFGNALDNAIRAVNELDGAGARSISLVVRRVAGVVSIHVENPFSGSVELRDGLPVTTKDDRASHGFGLRSMRLTAERYGGTLTVLAEGDRFHVNAIFPAG